MPSCALLNVLLNKIFQEQIGIKPFYDFDYRGFFTAQHRVSFFSKSGLNAKFSELHPDDTRHTLKAQVRS